MLRIILGLLISYLIGSIPSVYILGRVFKGIDIRKHGSGNIGATNAFRVLGPVFGISALIFDIAKGVACPTLIADNLALADSHHLGMALRIIFGLTAVAGHNWTVFLNFRGGKGVATSLGVIIGLAIIAQPLKIALFFIILTWITIFLISGFVSLASIISAVLFPILMVIYRSPPELAVLSIILAVFIIFRHNSNIYRLLHHQEHRFNTSKPLQRLFFKK